MSIINFCKDILLLENLMRKRNFMKWSCSTMDVNIHNVFSETLQQQTRTLL